MYETVAGLLSDLKMSSYVSFFESTNRRVVSAPGPDLYN